MITGDEVDDGMLTWDNIPGIHGILVLNEAEAVHELDLGNLTGAMGREVSLDIGLGSWRRAPVSAGTCCCWCGRRRSERRSLAAACRVELTIPGQVAQVEAGGRHLGHVVLLGQAGMGPIDGLDRGFKRQRGDVDRREGSVRPVGGVESGSLGQGQFPGRALRLRVPS